jgi:hypothetical protein
MQWGDLLTARMSSTTMADTCQEPVRGGEERKHAREGTDLRVAPALWTIKRARMPDLLRGESGAGDVEDSRVDDLQIYVTEHDRGRGREPLGGMERNVQGCEEIR